jgi:acetyl esterase/lipase
MASELDPLLDDAVAFASRMRALGRTADVKLRIAPLLPHGWLNM